MLQKFKNRPFFKNVITLSFGTGLAHGISFFAQFALMKIFAPDQIGVVARFVAIVSILSIFFTGRYEQAIVLPKDEEKGVKLVLLSLLITTLASALIMLPILIFPSFFSEILKLTAISHWLWLIPVTAWFMAGYNILFYWLNRTSRYKAMASSKMVENGSRAIIQIGLGVLTVGTIGLITGRVVGHVLAFFYFLNKCKSEIKIKLSAFAWSNLKDVAKEYVHFPKHLLISQGISSVYFQFPVLFLGWYFNDDIVGFFATANMFVGIPGILIARAVGDVFRQRATELYHEKGRFDDLVKQTLKSTLLIGVVPFAIIIICSPTVFAWYQPSWENTGIYIAILAVSGFFSFVITPIDKASLVVENTKYIFYWHLSRFLFNVLICALTMWLQLSPIDYLWMLVTVDLLHYFVELAYNYRFSKGIIKN